MTSEAVEPVSTCMAANKTCCRRASADRARPALTSGSRLAVRGSRVAGRGRVAAPAQWLVWRASRRAALSRRVAQAEAKQRRARTTRRAQYPANCSATADDHRPRLSSADTIVIFRLYPRAISRF